MAKPEATFVHYINSPIDTGIYTQSMYTPYSNGTPDCYYEAPDKHLWIEYKYEKKMPGIYRLNKQVSALQAQWLNRAYDNGQNVVVVAGFGKTDVVVFSDKSWNREHTRQSLESYTITRKDFIEQLNTYMHGNAPCFTAVQR